MAPEEARLRLVGYFLLARPSSRRSGPGLKEAASELSIERKTSAPLPAIADGA